MIFFKHRRSAERDAFSVPRSVQKSIPIKRIYPVSYTHLDVYKRQDRNGRAISKTLPLSRYTVREIKAPANYSINPTVMTAYLEFNGQIVTFEVQNTSVSTRCV